MNVSFILKLQVELYIMLVCILICSTFLIISFSVFNESYNNKLQAIARLSVAKSHYHKNMHQKKIVDIYEGRYHDLQDKNIIGKEDRLKWVDTIDKLNNKLKLLSLKYKLGAKKTLVSPQLVKRYPDIKIATSSMTLNMQLLHEGDLYSFLNLLERNNVGLFNVKKCTLMLRNQSKTKLDDISVNHNLIDSICELDWYTVQPHYADTHRG